MISRRSGDKASVRVRRMTSATFMGATVGAPASPVKWGARLTTPLPRSLIAAMKPTALISAAQSGNCELLRQLLESGADPNARGDGGETALMRAAAAGTLDAMALLIGQGADVEAITEAGNTALMYAAARGQLEAVRLLIAHGAQAARKNK